METHRVELTEKQKDWVRSRDDRRCNFPISYDLSRGTYDRCGARWRQLHVHHIVPQLWAARRLGWVEQQINNPDNLITLCRDCHFRKIHGTDMNEVFAVYRDDKTAFAKMFERRRELVAQGIPYWETEWDEILLRIAHSRSERVAFFNPFPIPRRRLRAS